MQITLRPAKYLLIGVLATFAAMVSAEPSIDDVYKAATNGNLSQAESMMGEVLRAHPESAKAHYIHAEILAKANRIDEARAELSKADQLQPGLGFVKPAAVNRLKHQLYPSGVAAPAETGGSSLLMWGGVIALGLILVVAFRAFARRPANNYAATPYNQPNYGTNPPMPGYGPSMPPQGGGMGSGIMGGLATGVAVGAGVVAGEALMHNILDGDHPNHNDEHYRQTNQPAPDNDDLGGQDFGISDNSSWDDGGGSSWSDNSSGGDSGDWS